MSSFPNSPRLLKGALVGLDPAKPLASVVVFQYNPETMTRSLEARSGAGGDTGDRTEVLRLSGPPKERITLSVEFDATDALEKADPLALVSGVGPSLAALEMLLYPESAVVIANDVLAGLGRIDLVPPEAPLTLFVWGPARVVPVRLLSFSLVEQAFDARLNPILAKVDLTLGVLSTSDLPVTSPGYPLFLAHQIAREVLATTNVLNSAQNLGAGPKLF